MAATTVSTTPPAPWASGRPSEKALSTLWRRSPSLPDGLTTQDGRRLRVLYAGRSNPREGPDFLDARLAAESGEMIVGDVELHVRAPDWYGHGHHLDPNYNGVILHVVLTHRGRRDTRQQSGAAAPVASLGPLVGELERAGQETEPPPSSLQVLDDDALAEALDSAGDARFAARTQGMRLELRRTPPDEVAHQAIMEGLGYASNRRPFRELGVRVPFAAAAGLREEPAATRLAALRALLIGTAGFLDHEEVSHEARTLKRLYLTMSRRVRCASGAGRRGPMHSSQWRTFRVRPSNHPIRRILGGSHLMDRYSFSGLARGLQDDVRTLEGSRLRGRLEAGPFVGPGRAGDLTVNAVLPFVRAMAEERGDRELARRCLETYRAFPALGANDVTREMARLLGRDRVSGLARGARRQQGLIHMYRQMRRGGSWVTAPAGTTAVRPTST